MRILTRDPARATQLAELGVEVVCGDLRNPTSVRRAADGADTIVAAAHGFAASDGNSPDSVDRRGNRHLIDAAAEAGASVVLVSVVGAGPGSQLDLFRAKYDAEQYLWSTGVPATVVRATAFIETWIGILGEPLQRNGRGLVFGRGVNPINFVSATAVAALLERAVVDPRLRGQTIEIGGPSNITMCDFVALLAAQLGLPDSPRHIPRTVLRVMSTLLRRIRPSIAAQAKAAVIMDTHDMTFDDEPLRLVFPDLPDTSVQQVIAAGVRT